MLRRAFAALLILWIAVPAAIAAEDDGDAPSPPSIRIEAFEKVERLSDPENGEAIALLGPITIGQENIFRIRAQKMVIWMHPEADDRVFDLIEGMRNENRLVPLWAIRAIYAEGGRSPVIFHLPGKIFRCAALYLDLAREKGLIVDAEVRLNLGTASGEGELPDLVLRAAKFRSRKPGEWIAEGVRAYSSDYQDPEIALDIERVVLKDEMVAGALGKLRRIRLEGAKGGVPEEELEAVLEELRLASTTVAGKSIEFDRIVSRAFDIPFMRWPDVKVDLDGVGATVHVRVGRRGTLGTGIELGAGMDRKPVAFLFGGGYYDGNGPMAFGQVNVDALDGKLKGLSYTNYMHDHGTQFGITPPSTERWWTKNQYRWEFSDVWRLDGEYADLSDMLWLRVWDEREFKEEKEQETLLHLRGRGWPGYLSAITKWQTIREIETVERLPSVRGDLPVLNLIRFGESGSGNPIALQMAGGMEAADLRFRPGALSTQPDFTTTRFFTDPTLFFAFDLGPVRVVPFGTMTFTYYEETPGGGADTRWSGAAGLRLDTQLSRWFGKVRHVVNLQLTYTDLFALTDRPEKYFQMDPVDALSKWNGFEFRWRNRLQRVSPSEGLREFLSFEILALYFPEGRRPQNRVGDGFVELDFEWQVKKDFATYFRLSVQADDWRPQTGAIGGRWRTTGGLLFWADLRHLDGDSNVLTMTTEFEVDRRWNLIMFNQFDLFNGELSDQTVLIQRVGKTAVFGLRMAHDPGEVDFSMALTIDLLHQYRRRKARQTGNIRSELGWQ